MEQSCCFDTLRQRLFLLMVFGICFQVNSTLWGQAQPVDFARDIQPILSENCYYCHGQDAEVRQADLRLDIEEDAHNYFESGDAENSDLFLRISSGDHDELMPPPDSNRQLTQSQIELIKRWINEGGNWGKHWAYTPISKPNADTSSTNPIDYWIGRGHQQYQLTFSPPADRVTLIRRVAVDLTGLPPTLDQVLKFQNDSSPDAYANMIDRYLASPAYGERMAWNWLDAARYADSNGYQGDNERTMWPWRDWVIQAYNDNMPFDQYSKWQLAGDLLPDATPEQILATGFNRNHPINGEGGRIAEENRIDYVMDMAETTGTVWMGLTFNCCRCHDHKYDPLTQNDYYSLFAFFDQTPVDGSGGNAQTKPVLAVPSPQQSKAIRSIENQLIELKTKHKDLGSLLVDSQSRWELTARKNFKTDNRWVIFDPTSQQAQTSDIKRLEDSSLLTSGANPDNDVYQIEGAPVLKSITGIRLEVLRDSSMTLGGLARSPSSNFVLTDFEVFIVQPKLPATQIKIVSALADFEQLPIRNAFDGNPKTGWGVWASGKDMTQNHEAVFKFGEPVSIPQDAKLRIVLKQESQHKKHNIGRFRISVTDHQNPQLLGINSGLLVALETPPEKRSERLSQLVRQSFLRQNDEFTQSEKDITEAQAQLKKLNAAVPQVMVMGKRKTPRKSYRLNRGSYQEPLNEVFPRVPGMFESIPADTTPDRLALANWLFDEANPLTARVSVNRLWSQFFGTGIVKTTEDFGVQGEPPSHPELLDWLAAEYRESGWDTKHLIRLILLSRTYQQSSKTTSLHLDVDPKNRFLARSSRFRMPSWMIRDHALAASGRLVTTVGGEPVNSYQPAGVWEEASFGKKKYKLGTDDALYRRSIYTFWRRIAAPTMIFDNADRMVCSVKDFRTNTPLHALNTLNDVTFVEASRLLATDVLKQKLSDELAIGLIYKRILTRRIREDEQNILIAALNRTRRRYQSDPKSAQAFVDLGETPPAPQIEAAELASWTSLCLAVLNLDEALTRQ